jgi:hypothetical protein
MHHLALKMLHHNACLYSHHIKGLQNVIVNSLSHNFHFVTDLFVSTFQVPPCFSMSPLSAETTSWLMSLNAEISLAAVVEVKTMPSVSWHGFGGS